MCLLCVLLCLPDVVVPGVDVFCSRQTIRARNVHLDLGGGSFIHPLSSGALILQAETLTYLMALLKVESCMLTQQSATISESNASAPAVVTYVAAMASALQLAGNFISEVCM